MSKISQITRLRRYRYWAEKIIAGLETQRERILNRREPILLDLGGGRSIPFKDLTDVPAHDLDYYVFELGRLRELGRRLKNQGLLQADVQGALDSFDESIPHLRELRDPLTHPADSRLDDLLWFDDFFAVSRMDKSHTLSTLGTNITRRPRRLRPN